MHIGVRAWGHPPNRYSIDLSVRELRPNCYSAVRSGRLCTVSALTATDRRRNLFVVELTELLPAEAGVTQDSVWQRQGAE